MDNRWPGSIWWKFDFHNHTPCSSDYESAERGTLTPREWLLSYMRAEIDCVAITDHNDGGWIELLKTELSNMKDEKDTIGDYRNLIVYPGVELTTSEGIHVIGIFDPEFGEEKIHRISSLVNLPDAGINAEKICAEGVENVCKVVRQEGGVVVLAHAEKKKGIFEARVPDEEYQPLREVRQIIKVLALCDALEVHNTNCPAVTRFAEEIKDKAIIDGSDAHRTTDSGSRYSWIKMSGPTIEGLKLALIDPESSVIRKENVTQSPNTPPTQRITSLSIDQMKLRKSSKLQVEFSPWMSSIIGGRGSGKSTLVESLRLALARVNEVEVLNDSEVKRSFDRFKKVSINRSDTGMIRQDTVLSACYESDDAGVTENYKLEWKRDDFQVFRNNEQGDWELTGLNESQARERFPVRIFSQKQIFEMADRPRAILEYIDKSIDIDLRQWAEKKESLEKSLRDLLYIERECSNKLTKKSELETEKQEVARKARVSQQSNLASEVNTYQKNANSKQAIDTFIEDIQEKIDHISSQLGPDNIFADANLAETNTTVPSDQVRHLANSLIANLQNEFDQIRERLSNMAAKLESFVTSSETRDFRRQLDQQIDQYREKIKELQTEGITSVGDAERVLDRQTEIDNQLEELAKTELELVKNRGKILRAYVSLIRHRKRLTKYRQDFINAVLQRTPNLKISILPFSDLDASVDTFRRILRLQDNTFVDDILSDRQADGDHQGLLGKLTQTGIHAPVHGRVSELKLGILNNEDEILGERLHGRLLNAIQRMSDDDKDRLLEWFPEDLVKVEFRRDEASQFQPLHSASAGQKTSAILSFILLHGTEPLILDQPEDDLDNSLISSLLVAQLRLSKLKRQVITVTHNPNIVVNGDSELVLPMEFLGGEIQLNHTGELQQEVIRRKICEVMEGGEEAFRQRYKRILEDLAES